MLKRLTSLNIFLILLLGVSIFVPSIAVANTAPTAVGTIPDQTLVMSDLLTNIIEVEVIDSFSDPDGDTLTYSATSSDTTKATVSVSTTLGISVAVNITPVAAGTATITVTATDPGGLTATQTFSATVKPPNRAPTAEGTIPTQSLEEGGTVDINVDNYFSDPDGDVLRYTVSSSDTTIATTKVTKSVVLTVTAVAAGTTTITVTARDPLGLSTTQTFSVEVSLPNNAPTTVGTIPDLTVKLGETDPTVDVSGYFSDADGDTLTYTASSSDTAKATVSVSSETVTITPVAVGTATITVTATDPDGLNAAQEFSVTVNPINNAPTGSDIPHQNISTNQSVVISLPDFFSDPDGDTLTYTASSADTAKATATVVNTDLVVNPQAADVTVEITATATDPGGLSASVSFHVTITVPVEDPPNPADTLPGLSSDELSQLGTLLTFDTVIFNELHNGSNDATDWLELRNVSTAAIALDNWQLTILTDKGSVAISFPAGTVIPTGDVLLLTNTEMATADTAVLSVVSKKFVLPQTDFALILRERNGVRRHRWKLCPR